MKPIVVDAKGWAKANLWRHPSGELCVRPGLRRLASPESSRTFVGGFSVQNSYTSEVWHYLFDIASAGRADLKLRIYDETFQIWQTFSVNADVVPRVITHAVVEGQLLITSPDFPSIFGIVGSGVRFAESVASDNPATSAIAVPRGICTKWCNRVVVCDGRSVYISDPIAATGGDVRTFVAANQNQRPGVIYGVHEGAGDALVVVTSDGTYALSGDAAAVGIVGSNGTGWRLTSSTSAMSYCSSCVVRGRIYALTRDGWAAVDTESDNEMRLTEPLMPRAVFGRVSLADFRNARMYATDEGPLVMVDGLNAIHRTDVTRQTSSWWRTGGFENDARVRGVLRELSGRELLIGQGGIFAMEGDFDGEIALTSGLASVTGLLFGVIAHDPETNRLVRHVDVAAASAGLTNGLGVSLRGSRKRATTPADGNGYTIGTSTWTQAGKRLTTSPLTSCRFDFSPALCERTDDVSLEIEAVGCMNRISERFSISFADSAMKRPGKVA